MLITIKSAFLPISIEPISFSKPIAFAPLMVAISSTDSAGTAVGSLFAKIGQVAHQAHIANHIVGIVAGTAIAAQGDIDTGVQHALHRGNAGGGFGIGCRVMGDMRAGLLPSVSSPRRPSTRSAPERSGCPAGRASAQIQSASGSPVIWA